MPASVPVAVTGVPRLRVLTAANVSAAAQLVARSFDEDPGSAAFVADPMHRLRLNELSSRRALQAALPYAAVYGVEVDAELAGVAIWHPPAARMTSLSASTQYYRALVQDLPVLPPVLARLIRTLVKERRAVLRLLGQRRDAVRQASAGATWHLAVLATDAAHRGRGLARLLVDHVLERCDADGLAVWLETTSPVNPPIYERFGFRTVAQIDEGRDLPTWWVMRRPPSPPAD